MATCKNYVHAWQSRVRQYPTSHRMRNEGTGKNIEIIIMLHVGYRTCRYCERVQTGVAIGENPIKWETAQNDMDWTGVFTVV